MQSQEAKIFQLPNGLEVRARHLANTGVVHARLVVSWTEGNEIAPIGTAWIMSEVLPALGCNGMERGAFQTQKDQSGIISNISVGRGWIAWEFDSDPANADLMIQFLADESLRPFWPGALRLSELLEKIWQERHFLDIRAEAAQKFRVAAQDPNVPQMLAAPIGQDKLISLWAANVWRPEKAILCIAGDIESISLVRLVNQHFGPWPGTIPNAPKRAVNGGDSAKDGQWLEISHYKHRDSAIPVVWFGVGDLPSIDASEKEGAIKALLPWILESGLPRVDETLSGWEACPSGT
jgi:hypothetical protein